jgi:hypothetical protein
VIVAVAVEAVSVQSCASSSSSSTNSDVCTDAHIAVFGVNSSAGTSSSSDQ